MELIIGTIGVCFLLAYIMFKTEQEPLKILLFGLLISSLTLLSGVVFHESNCDVFETNVFEAGNTTQNNITITNEIICQETPSGASESFVKYMSWLVRLLWIYMIYHLLYSAIMFWFIIPKRKNGKKKK